MINSSRAILYAGQARTYADGRPPGRPGNPGRHQPLPLSGRLTIQEKTSLLHITLTH